MGYLKSVALTVMALTFSAVSNANLLVNGDFEDDVGLTGSRWGVYSSINGWQTYSGPGIEIQRNTIVAAQSGNQYVELDSHTGTDTNSVMYQTIDSLSVGASYELSFWYHARTNNGAANDNGIEVLWGDSLPGATVLDLEGYSRNSNLGWMNFSLDLVATAETMFLSFGATGLDNTLGGFIDNVSLTAVPEPGTLALFAIGAAGLLIGRRRLQS